MPSMESRIAQLETNGAVMAERMINLTTATKENTSAIKDLTTMLTYNKGIIAASAKFAGLMTLVIGAAWEVGTWFANIMHGAAK